MRFILDRFDSRVVSVASSNLNADYVAEELVRQRTAYYSLKAHVSASNDEMYTNRAVSQYDAC